MKREGEPQFQDEEPAIEPYNKIKRSTEDILMGMINPYDLGRYPDLSPEKVKESFKEMISQWHDEIKPEYIFLNETSATPFGYLFKETWKTAYPKDKLPKLYRIDPPSLSYHSAENLKEIKDYLSKRVKNKDARIVVFDETGPTGASAWRVNAVLSGRRRFSGHWEGKDDDVEDYRKNFAIPGENIFMYRGLMALSSDVAMGLPVWPEAKVTQKKSSMYYGDPNDLEYGLTGRTIKDPELKKEALKYISELKSVGREIGEEIREGKKG
jgi:hypothetical protein